MMSYYGKHKNKQFIKDKALKLDYKFFWQEGSFLHVKPYCGNHTKIPDKSSDHGPNLVLEMVKKTESLSNG